MGNDGQASAVAVEAAAGLDEQPEEMFEMAELAVNGNF